jgi:hypothetical protein
MKFDDGRVVTCAMLGASPTVLHSASSSSDSSGSESIIASPPPVPDMVISLVLPDISEVPEPVEAGSHMETSTDMFCIFLDVLFIVEFDIGWAGGHGGGDADAGPHQMVQGQLSVGVVDEDDGQIIDCLEHIRNH